MRFKHYGTVAIATMVIGCAEGGNDALTTAVRDSAGVRIVEHVGEAPDLGWTVAAEPSVVIGGPDVADEYALFQVVGAARLADGAIAVANGGSNEIKVYEPDGAFRFAVGGEGEGPGEFSRMRFLIRIPGDSLAVDDIGNARVTVLSPEGRVARDFRIAGVRFASVRDAFDDGSYLASGGAITAPDESFDGLRRFDVPWMRIDPVGELTNDVGAFPSGESFFVSFDNGFGVREAMFGRNSATLAFGDDVLFADGGIYALRRMSNDGSLGEIDPGFARLHRGKRDSHIDPPTSSNAIMQRAQLLLRREQ